MAVADPPLGHEHVDAPTRPLVVLVDGQVVHVVEAAALLYVLTEHLQKSGRKRNERVSNHVCATAVDGDVGARGRTRCTPCCCTHCQRRRKCKLWQVCAPPAAVL